MRKNPSVRGKSFDRQPGSPFSHPPQSEAVPRFVLGAAPHRQVPESGSGSLGVKVMVMQPPPAFTTEEEKNQRRQGGQKGATQDATHHAAGWVILCGCRVGKRSDREGQKERSGVDATWTPITSSRTRG